MIKGFKNIFLQSVAIAFVATLFSGCKNNEHSLLNDQINAINHTTTSFNPGFFTNDSLVHYSMQVNYTDRVYLLSEDTTYILPGVLRVVPTNSPFEVVYKKSTGAVIGSYKMGLPYQIINCTPGDSNHIVTSNNMKFRLSLPADSNITIVDLKENGVLVSTLHLSTNFVNVPEQNKTAIADSASFGSKGQKQNTSTTVDTISLGNKGQKNVLPPIVKKKVIKKK